jgi:steroid 5-alpha reductase family enzyme
MTGGKRATAGIERASGRPGGALDPTTLLTLTAILILGAAAGLLFGNPERPVYTAATATAAMALACFAAGWISGDYSWVDRLWSIIPALYGWFFTAGGELSPPLLLPAILITLWSLRLTFNFGRRGGYGGLEDHRWGVLRRRIPGGLRWQLFNLGFISLFQHALLLLISLPVLIFTRHHSGALSVAELLAAAALLLFLILETLADQQQWRFQQAKRAAASGHGERVAAAAAAQDIRRGFLTRGLFRFSRHPNYFGELGVWWMVYLLGAFADGTVLHWSGIGVLLLTLLFLGSTAFTESITAARYPEYPEYRRTTSPIIPLPPRPG